MPNEKESSGFFRLKVGRVSDDGDMQKPGAVVRLSAEEGARLVERKLAEACDAPERLAAAASKAGTYTLKSHYVRPGRRTGQDTYAQERFKPGMKIDLSHDDAVAAIECGAVDDPEVLKAAAAKAKAAAEAEAKAAADAKAASEKSDDGKADKSGGKGGKGGDKPTQGSLTP